MREQWFYNPAHGEYLQQKRRGKDVYGHLNFKDFCSMVWERYPNTVFEDKERKLWRLK